MSVSVQASLEASDAPSSTSFGSSLSPKKVVSAEHPSNPVIPDEGPIQVTVFKEQLAKPIIRRLMPILEPKLVKMRCPKDRDQMATWTTLQNAVQKVGEEEMMQNFPRPGGTSASTSNALAAAETMLADAWYDEEADRYVRKKSRDVICAALLPN